MSVANVRTALETALNGISPALSTAWPNVAFDPVAGAAYQRADILFSEPDNPEMGETVREQGYMQVRLMYPLGVGSGAAEARAELIRTTFYRGASFTASGQVVIIDSTPEVAGGEVDGDRWSVIVRIRFHSDS